MKYLVVSLTPKTREYMDLEEALWNLYGEGVDISYVIVNIGIKGPEKILEILNKLSSVYNDIAIPYTLITQGRELSNPLNYLKNIIKTDKQLLEIIKQTRELWSINLESDDDLGFLLSEMWFKQWSDAISERLFFDMRYRIGEKIKKVLNRIDKNINRSSFNRYLSKLIEENRIFYIYDIDKLSKPVTNELIRLYHSERHENLFFRLDRKSILRLYMKIFPFKNGHIKCVKDKLKAYVKTFEQSFANIEKYIHIYVEHGKYNERGKSFSPKIEFFIKAGNISIHLLALINYYDITKNLSKNEEISELIKLNLLAIGYKAAERFLEYLYEQWD